MRGKKRHLCGFAHGSAHDSAHGSAHDSVQCLVRHAKPALQRLFLGSSGCAVAARSFQHCRGMFEHTPAKEVQHRKHGKRRSGNPSTYKARWPRLTSEQVSTPQEGRCTSQYICVHLSLQCECSNAFLHLTDELQRCRTPGYSTVHPRVSSSSNAFATDVVAAGARLRFSTTALPTPTDALSPRHNSNAVLKSSPSYYRG